MKAKLIWYWVTTALLAFALLSGGVAEVVHLRGNVEGMVRLGYPLYFITILGFWKLLGGIALLVPRFPRLKEWAYAGAFFNLTGAVVSHAVCGETGHVIAPLVLAVLTIASWALRPQDRIVGELFPARSDALVSTSR